MKWRYIILTIISFILYFIFTTYGWQTWASNNPNSQIRQIILFLIIYKGKIKRFFSKINYYIHYKIILGWDTFFMTQPAWFLFLAKIILTIILLPIALGLIYGIFIFIKSIIKRDLNFILEEYGTIFIDLNNIFKKSKILLKPLSNGELYILIRISLFINTIKNLIDNIKSLINKIQSFINKINKS